eukprot:XP_016663417.1 PREDICTED: uncharacterized protein LOC103310521 [Acyrthosiphon pisum]
MPEPPTWIRSLDDSYRTYKLKPSINNTNLVSPNQIRESTKSTTSQTTSVFKKVTSIFTTPVPQKYNNDNNSISENNLTQMNLLVQDQLLTETNSDNCLFNYFHLQVW